MKPIALYWWTHGDARITNVGDSLSPLIVQAVSGRAVEYATIDRCDLIAIGSIMELAVRTQRRTPLAVWGSGFITAGSGWTSESLHCAAVRGPLTGSRIGGAPALGDPALLVGAFFTPRVRGLVRIGLVPHYTDLDHPMVAALRSEPGLCHVISPLQPPIAFLAAVAACEVVLSSSLHGLVVADAYGIPNAWIKLGDGVIGAGYKYRDYLGAFGFRDAQPLPLADPDQVNEALAQAIAAGYRRPEIELLNSNLIAAFPGIA